MYLPFFFYKKETRIRSINNVTITSNSFVNGFVTTQLLVILQFKQCSTALQSDLRLHETDSSDSHITSGGQMTVVVSNSLGLKEKGYKASRYTVMCHPVAVVTLNNLETKIERRFKHSVRTAL